MVVAFQGGRVCGSDRPTDHLRNMAAGLDGMLARGALKEAGGRSKMAAFERLIRDLARIFE